MIKVLLVPSSDYLGHPFPQRHNQIFERLNCYEDFEVHVVKFNLFDKNRLSTTLVLHEMRDLHTNSIASYYFLNALIHASHIRQLVRQHAIDVVVLSNLAGPFAFTIIDKLSRLDLPIIVDLPDYYPTSAAGNLLDPLSLRGKFFSAYFDVLLRQIMRHANLVTVVSQPLKAYAENAGANQAILIPNGISECFLRLQNGSKIREKLGFRNEEFIIGYIGSVEFWLDMKSLFKGVAIAKRRGIPVKLLIVGKSLHTGYMNIVENQAKEEGVWSLVTWLDFVPHEDVPSYMAAIDAGTIPFAVSNPTAYYSAPNKLWEYLSQLKPVLSTPIPESVSNSKYISIVSNPADYALVISRLFQRNALLLKKTENGYALSQNRTWANSAQMFSSVIRNLLKG
jgi:glycosyltransferase involved in cell wall biosynthesis